MPRHRTLFISAIVTAFLIGMFMVSPMVSSDPPAAAGPPGPQVTICHTPPNNPANFYGVAAKTITVGERAVPGHLEHGDTLGPCR